jgi:hypothetical protein
LVSCKQTTSGRRSSSQGSSRGTRCLTELTFQVAIRTDPTVSAPPTAARRPTRRPPRRIVQPSSPGSARTASPSHPSAGPSFRLGNHRTAPPSDGLNVIVPAQPRQTPARDDAGSPAHLGAECPLAVKASVHGGALRALASDETQSSAPRLTFHLNFGESECVLPMRAHVFAHVFEGVRRRGMWSG